VSSDNPASKIHQYLHGKVPPHSKWNSKLSLQTKQAAAKRPRKILLVFKLLDRMLLVVVELQQNSPAIRQCPQEASEVITPTGETVQ
jgi:hypothetical protein